MPLCPAGAKAPEALVLWSINLMNADKDPSAIRLKTEPKKKAPYRKNIFIFGRVRTRYALHTEDKFH